MTKKSTVVITGANGFIGSALVKYFSKKEYTVRALVRQPDNYKDTRYVTYYAYDMTKVPSDSVFDKADYLIHTAYIKEAPNGKDLVTLNLAAAKTLLEKSRAHKLKKNIFLSSMSARKDALSAYGKQKFAIEQLFCKKNDVILRSGLVIGSNGLAQRIVTFMRTKHMAPLIGGGLQPIQIIHIDDLAIVADKALHKNTPSLLSIGTPRVYTYKQFYESIRRTLGIYVVLINVPFFIPLTVIRLINFLHLPLGVTEDNLRGLQQMRAYDTAPDLRALDISLVELDEALERTFQASS